MADRKAYIAKVHDDGTFDLLHYGPQLLEGIDAKFFVCKDGESVAQFLNREVVFSYVDGRFVITPKS
jgi:hypothetical protein